MAKRASKAKSRAGAKQTDDDQGNYIIVFGEIMKDRYEVKEKLGKGSFGQVVRAYDNVLEADVAIKIVKNKSAFYNAAQIEISVLRKLNTFDPMNKYNIVRYLGTFEHLHHVCIVSELLGNNLYEVLSKTQFRGLPMTRIRSYAHQIFTALAFFRQPQIALVHCDLKPENILVHPNDSSKIRIIDFGSSCENEKPAYTYVQSRFYRAPEILLGAPYSYVIDAWSAGCIMMELYTGRPLFSGSDEIDQMHKICESVEPASVKSLIEMRATKTSKYFKIVAGNLTRNSTTKKYFEFCGRTLSSILDNVIMSRRQINIPDHFNQEQTLFLDLVSKLLVFEPIRRITPHDALLHPFFTETQAASTAPLSSHRSPAITPTVFPTAMPPSPPPPSVPLAHPLLYQPHLNIQEVAAPVASAITTTTTTKIASTSTSTSAMLSTNGQSFSIASKPVPGLLFSRGDSGSGLVVASSVVFPDNPSVNYSIGDGIHDNNINNQRLGRWTASLIVNNDKESVVMIRIQAPSFPRRIIEHFLPPGFSRAHIVPGNRLLQIKMVRQTLTCTVLSIALPNDIKYEKGENAAIVLIPPTHNVSAQTPLLEPTLVVLRVVADNDPALDSPMTWQTPETSFTTNSSELDNRNSAVSSKDTSSSESMRLILPCTDQTPFSQSVSDEQHCQPPSVILAHPEVRSEQNDPKPLDSQIVQETAVDADVLPLLTLTAKANMSICLQLFRQLRSSRSTEDIDSLINEVIMRLIGPNNFTSLSTLTQQQQPQQPQQQHINLQDDAAILSCFESRIASIAAHVLKRKSGTLTKYSHSEHHQTVIDGRAKRKFSDVPFAGVLDVAQSQGPPQPVIYNQGSTASQLSFPGETSRYQYVPTASIKAPATSLSYRPVGPAGLNPLAPQLRSQPTESVQPNSTPQLVYTPL